MKNFLLTMKYPYTGYEQIQFIFIEARNMQSAMNKARKHVKHIYAGGGYNTVSILHCEEVECFSTADEAQGLIERRIRSLRKRLEELEILERGLRRIVRADTIQ